MVLALLGVTVFGSPVVSVVLGVPLLPGLAIAALLNIMHGGSEELASAMYFNAAVYSLLMFGLWQRKISKRWQQSKRNVN